MSTTENKRNGRRITTPLTTTGSKKTKIQQLRNPQGIAAQTRVSVYDKEPSSVSAVKNIRHKLTALGDQSEMDYCRTPRDPLLGKKVITDLVLRLAELLFASTW